MKCCSLKVSAFEIELTIERRNLKLSNFFKLNFNYDLKLYDIMI